MLTLFLVLNTPDLGPIQSIEELLVVVVAQVRVLWVVRGVISYSGSMNQKKAELRHHRGDTMVGDRRAGVLHPESAGNLAGGRDGTTKSRPPTPGPKTDGLPRWEHRG